MSVMMGDEEEEDPLALIVETLRAATGAVREANAAAEAARAEAKEFHGKLEDKVGALAVKVSALEKKVDAFTKRLNAMMASRLARYGWGLAGAFIGLSLGTFLLLMLAAAQRTHG
jgi:phage shock protein A